MRYVKISDLLDGLEAPDIELDESRAVSPERIKEIAMNKIHNEQKKRTHSFKRPAAVILAAALTLALGVTAFAAYQGGFFHNAFGTGVEGREAFTNILTNEKGEVVKTEHYPAIDRVEVDEEKAGALVGDYVTAVGQSVTLENYTFTLENVLLDENGVGALTVHVENPDGHGLEKSGRYSTEHPTPFDIAINRTRGDFSFMDDRDYLVTDSFTETEATYVYYVTPFEPLPADEELVLRIRLHGESDLLADWPTAQITIPATDKIPARTFAAEGVTADLSPVGLTLRYDFGDGWQKVADDLVIRYADGSEYIVKGDDLINISVSSVSRDWSTVWIAFNRLADADSIVDIVLAGKWLEGDDLLHTYDLVLTSAD